VSNPGEVTAVLSTHLLATAPSGLESPARWS
jgi:hypothetical protein